MAEPKVRFKQIDGIDYSVWKQGRFGDLIDVYEEKVSSDSILPVLTSSKTDGIQYQSDHFGREQLHDITGYNVIPRGYCTYRNRSDGTDFTFNINNICDKGIVSKFYPVFRAKDQCNLYFLMTLMNNEPNTVRKIAATAKGTGQKVLSFTDLQKIEINIPCLEEQQKIADFLSAVDEVISTSEQEVANLETQKKAVMKKIFSQEVRFKRDDGTDFPEWEETLFLSLIDEIIDFRGRTPKKLGMDWAQYKTDHLALSAINVKKGYIDFNVDPHYGDNALFEKWMSGRELRQGQVLFTTEAPMGNVAQVPDDKPYILSQRTIAFNVKVDLICDDFLAHLLLAPDTQKRLYELATGGTAQGVSQKSLAKLNVYIPTDIEEQRLIAAFLSDFDEAIAAAKKELELWKELKKGLLQQMFV